MKKEEFKYFLEGIEKAEEESDLWYMPTLFMALTPKQYDSTVNVLLKRGIFEVTKKRTPDLQGWIYGVKLPSGIVLYERESY